MLDIKTPFLISGSETENVKGITITTLCELQTAPNSKEIEGSSKGCFGTVVNVPDSAALRVPEAMTIEQRLGDSKKIKHV